MVTGNTGMAIGYGHPVFGTGGRRPELIGCPVTGRKDQEDGDGSQDIGDVNNKRRQ